MAIRGRKPTPTPLKILRGTRADRIPKAEPHAPAGRPKPPAHLDKVARAEWRRMVPILEKLGVLTQAEGGALAVYCVAYSRWVTACEAIDAEAEVAAEAMAERMGRVLDEGRKATDPRIVAATGLLESTGQGGSKVSPLVLVAQQAEAQMMRALAEFGCTPSSRSRVKVQGEEKRDALGEFLSRKGQA
jgi:P27 family predicted phage terminase small subunit